MLALQGASQWSVIDINGQQGHESEVTVQSGSFHSITDSILNAKSGVANQSQQNSSIRFTNEPAIAGREDNIIIDCGEACSITLAFYDELGREVGTPMSDGVISSHHELQFMQERPG